MTVHLNKDDYLHCVALYGFGQVPDKRNAEHILTLCQGVPFAPEMTSLRRTMESLSCNPVALADHASGARYHFCVSLYRKGRTYQNPIAICWFNRAGEEAELEFMVVGSECRKQGVGYALLHMSHSFVWSLGIKRICLEVSVSNKSALSLYQKLGYSRIGYRKSYYQNGDDALVLALVSPFRIS